MVFICFSTCKIYKYQDGSLFQLFSPLYVLQRHLSPLLAETEPVFCVGVGYFWSRPSWRSRNSDISPQQSSIHAVRLGVSATLRALLCARMCAVALSAAKLPWHKRKTRLRQQVKPTTNARLHRHSAKQPGGHRAHVSLQLATELACGAAVSAWLRRDQSWLSPTQASTLCLLPPITLRYSRRQMSHARFSSFAVQPMSRHHGYVCAVACCGKITAASTIWPSER